MNTLIKEYCRLHTQCDGNELTCCKFGEFSNNIVNDYKSNQTHSLIVLKSSGILPNLFRFQIDKWESNQIQLSPNIDLHYSPL